MSAVAGLYQEFQACGTEVLDISTDGILSHKVFHETSPHASQVTYPLLSDRTGEVSRLYGVYSYQNGTSYRATFLIDPKGVIRHYAAYPDEVGREMKEVLRVLQALQMYEQTHQLEPAGWQPGMKGILSNIQLAGEI